MRASEKPGRTMNYWGCPKVGQKFQAGCCWRCHPASWVGEGPPSSFGHQQLQSNADFCLLKEPFGLIISGPLMFSDSYSQELRRLHMYIAGTARRREENKGNGTTWVNI